MPRIKMLVPAFQKKGRREAASGFQLDFMRMLSSSTAEQVLAEFNSHEGGLEPCEIELARAAYGPNKIVRAKRDPAWLRFVKAFADPFTGVLALLAAITLATDVVFAAPSDRDPSTFLLIIAMIVVSGLMRFIQEGKSGEAAQALARTIETTCNVERAGEGKVEVPLAEVVCGDIIHLSVGDIVPADARLIQARDLYVSMSSLTGESLPVERTGAPCPDAARLAAADLPNMVYMGSSVVSGTGTAVVVATGTHTLFGGIAEGLGVKRGETAYDEGIASVSRLLLRFMLVMAPLVFVVNGITKGDWLSALLFSLSVAVGLTPEMLPMIVTTCLAKGARDLAGEQTIVKHLDSIQNLGALDVLCCDKTGTLTEDHVILERHLDINGAPDPTVLGYAFLNSFFGTGARNLMDSAIIERATKESARGDSGIDVDGLTGAWHLVDEVPFDFGRRRVSVVVEDGEGRRLMIVKGAVEEVSTCCSEVALKGSIHPLDDETKAFVMSKADDLARRGMRVLAVAIKRGDASQEALRAEDESGMTLVGYLAFLDPPKRSAASAIKALGSHGVATKVLTGDSLRVAITVAETIGLPVEGALEGSQIAELTDEELAERVEDVTIFAKLSPDQKVRVVRALRSWGHIVGFMGDGVNDAPAMQASDCGISVDTAADVSKEAADIILLKKDLGVLERGIVCGRRTYCNMNKYVKMTASSNFGNIFSVLAASIFLPFLPMTAVQLLLLNFINDCASTAIPWDGVDEEQLERPQRWQSGSIANFMRMMGPVSSIFDILTFLALFFWICPAAAGGAWATLDAASQAVFAGTFQACWFAESMCTQVLFVHLVRTERVPFIESRADWRICVLGISAVVLSLTIPEMGIAAELGFEALPARFLLLLVLIVAGYAGCVLLVRSRYIRRFGKLL